MLIKHSPRFSPNRSLVSILHFHQEKGRRGIRIQWNTIFPSGSIVSIGRAMWKLFKQISIIAPKVAETGIPSTPSKKLELSASARRIEAERWLNRNFVLGSSRSRVYYNTTLEFHPGNKFLDVSSLDSSAPLIVLPRR